MSYYITCAKPVFQHYPNSSALVVFAGIDPTVRQSGEFNSTHNHMSKRGSPYLRIVVDQFLCLKYRFLRLIFYTLTVYSKLSQKTAPFRNILLLRVRYITHIKYTRPYKFSFVEKLLFPLHHSSRHCYKVIVLFSRVKRYIFRPDYLWSFQ